MAGHPRRAEEAPPAVAACADLQVRMMADGTPIYGPSNGFGALDGRKVAPEKIRELLIKLSSSHAADVGDPMPDDAVQAMMAIRSNAAADRQRPSPAGGADWLPGP